MRRVILALLAPAAIATAVTASASAAVISPKSPIMKIGTAAINVAYAVRRTTVGGPRGGVYHGRTVVAGRRGYYAAACTLAGAFTCAVADITAAAYYGGGVYARRGVYARGGYYGRGVYASRGVYARGPRGGVYASRGVYARGPRGGVYGRRTVYRGRRFYTPFTPEPENPLG